MSNKIADLEAQIYTKRKEVRYDIRDLTVEQIVKKYNDSIEEEWDEYSAENNRVPNSYNLIYIPEYQRDFTWDRLRQSKLIESIILGLPIPFIFVAENESGAWEIVDGSQRIRTLHSFVNNNLNLQGLNSLNKLNGLEFKQLDPTRQGKFLNTALRLIVLSEETTEDVKKDMFERINKGSDILKPMESRKGIYKGLFNDFIYDYSSENRKYIELTPIDKWLEKRQEREELLLRFFALSHDSELIARQYKGIADTLDAFLKSKNEELEKLSQAQQQDSLQRDRLRIDAVVDFVSEYFENGFRTRVNPQTKRAVFEAISVGVDRFLQQNPNLQDYHFDKSHITKSLLSREFQGYCSGNQPHRKTKLSGRIDFIVNLLNGSKK